MLKKCLVVVIAACCAIALTMGLVRQADAANKPITVKGSDTMINLGQAWAEAFMKKTNIPVTVTGGGSGTGIAAMINGKTDICQASRPMKSEEIHAARDRGVSPTPIITAWDGIAVIVNPKNKAKQVTMTQLAKIYDGEISNWKDVGGADAKIVLLGREVNSGTHVFFKEHVIQGYKSSADYAKTMLMLPSTEALVDEVAKNANAIGYVGLGYVDPKRIDVLLVSTDGKKFVEPSVATVKNKTYPVSRPLYWYTNGKPKGNVKKMVDFALGKEGQKIVADLDFVPL